MKTGQDTASADFLLPDDISLVPKKQIQNDSNRFDQTIVAQLFLLLI